MATVHKHPVPTDSYDPKRPLNDLLVAQLAHFKHIARGLATDDRNALPAEPSIDNREGIDRFIAAITGVHVSRKRATPQLVAKPVRRTQTVGLSLAAVAEETPTKNKPAKSNSRAKPKSKVKTDTRGPKR